MPATSGFAEQPDMTLTDTLRQEVLAGVIAKLEHYVFPETATRVQQDIQQRLDQGGYSDIQGALQLAETVTQQLQTLGKDRHLRLHYSAEPLPELDAQSEPSPEEIAHQRHLSSLRNFDFNRVERLPGNVGYIELFAFEPPEFAAETAIAAMNFVAHTSALIFDIRHNGGGSPGMVALLCSYLFPDYPAVHLNDLYWRTDDSTHQWWTLPYVPGKRYLNKPVYVLTSQETFSAAEEFAYNLQVLKRATTVGETTRGGAHPGAGHRINDHFWIFVPTGRAINPITGSNWDETGVLPNVKVPHELALKTAHLLALRSLLDTSKESGFVRELNKAMQLVERELNELRADLISQLGVLR